MAIHAAPASPWPAKLAYLSAAIFTAASGTANLAFGWNKGTDLASSLTWAAVSLGVAVVFAISWPALIRACENRQWPAVAMAFVALMLSGAYSMTAALGSAAGGRMNAAATETVTAGAQKRAQADYDAAKADFAKLPTSRTAGEIEALIAAARLNPRAQGCAVDRETYRIACPKLEAELARAHERARLDKIMAEASNTLNAAPTRVANTDAKALKRYLSAIGIEIGAERLNDLLTLLAVVMIEAGGGLSLALGLALMPASAQAGRTEAPSSDVTDRPSGDELRVPAPPAVPVANPGRTMLVSLADPAESDIERLLRSAGSVTGFRQLAGKLGRPRSTVADECHRLAGAGRLTLARAGRSMRIELASRPN